MKLLIFSLVTILILLPSEVMAQSFQITKPATGFGIPETTHLGDILRNIVILFFSVGGIGFIIMILWGAVDWILSGGDKEKIAGARKRITTALIGLTVLALSFVIIVVAGQITGIAGLHTGLFRIPGLGAP